jgi:peptide/nickel transport system ATP-binding protein
MPELAAIGDSVHLVRCIRANEWVGSPARHGLQSREEVDKARSPEPILTVNDLDAYYGSKQVLQNVAFNVPNHECVAIVGESGSGKSTLARCLVGLHTRYRGMLTFEGAILAPGIHNRSDRTARLIQYIFQNPHSSLNPRKTVEQILVQPLDHFSPKLSNGSLREGAAIALSEVSLDPEVYLQKYPGELSGGEAQRVAIARALIASPSVLICDEITSSLDASVQAVIIELLRSLQARRDFSMIFITHNLALVRSISQTVVVLHDGAVIEQGLTSEVVNHPSARRTAQLFEDAPKLTVADL